ncbi:class F sortase, partial [Micrococcus luteus]
AHLSGPAAPWDEITATPVHVDVHQDGEQIVGAGIDLTQLDEGGDLDPEPQTVGWYGPPQWGTTPGERSQYAGVLAGHVVYYGVRDVFWNLGDVRAGAVVVVTYDDGTQAAFEADADAVSVEKEALTEDPANRWAWEPGGDDAKVTLITCDLVPGTGMTGNAFNNWVVQATRVA